MAQPPLPIADAVPLAPLTTLELGGPARHLVEAQSPAMVAAAVAWAAARKLPLLVLGGGSNVVISDSGFEGLVVRMAMRGLRFDLEGGQGVVRAAAGEPWDALVSNVVARGWAGLECLAGIPGLVGATPIQNVGAYGQEVAETIRAVTVLERASGRVVTLEAKDCGFGYRDSMFRRQPEDFVVLEVTFVLSPGGAPRVRYAELDAALAAQTDGEGDGGAAGRRRGPPRTDRRRGERDGPGVAAAQIHAAGPRRSEPAQRGIVLHQPGAAARRRCRRGGARRGQRRRGVVRRGPAISGGEADRSSYPRGG